MEIVRASKNNNYSTISNIPFNDKTLSLEARGLLAYLLTKPDNWQTSISILAIQSHTGRGKIQRILKELEEHGYVERKKIRDKNGRFYYETAVYEEPVTKNAAAKWYTVNCTTTTNCSTVHSRRD